MARKVPVKRKRLAEGGLSSPKRGPGLPRPPRPPVDGPVAPIRATVLQVARPGNSVRPAPPLRPGSRKPLGAFQTPDTIPKRPVELGLTRPKTKLGGVFPGTGEKIPKRPIQRPKR